MWKNMIRVIATLALASMLPLTATAQSVDDWKWSATLYGWFPTIGGKTSFPATGTGPNIDIDADTILDNLDFVFMGTIEGQRGRYGFFTDVVYLDLSGSKSATRDVTISRLALPVGADMNADLKFKGWLWTIAGTYGVVATPEHSMQVLAGARLIDAETKLNWQFNGNIASLPLAATGSSTVDESFWDAIIGVKGKLSFGTDHKWFVPYYLDIGTGESSFTWQGVIGIGYDFHWGAVTAAYRYLDYDFKSGKLLQDLTLNGPAIGVSFRW